MVMGSVVTNPSRSTVAKAKKISEELQARAVTMNNETGECDFLRAVCSWEYTRKRRLEQFLTAYKAISELISKAASCAHDDPLTAHQLLEQAMDIEYKLIGHCDDASNFRDAILGTFEPNKYTI